MKTAISTTVLGKGKADRDKVVNYIRRKGVGGNLTDKFIAETDWTVRGKALARALAITTCYPADANGAQAFIDDLLSLHDTDISTVPRDANVRIVARTMEEVRLQILAGEGRIAMGFDLDSRTSTGAAAANTVLTTAPAIALETADRTAWDTAMAAHKKAIADDAAFDPQYWEIHRAWAASKPSMDMIHWEEFAFANRDHTARMMDIEGALSKFIAGEGKWWNARDPDARKACYRAALDSVQAFRDAEARHDLESGMAEADRRWNALGDEVGQTRDALMNMPAPDLSALRWKLTQLRDGDGDLAGWSADYVRQTFVDIDRLIPAEEV